MKFIGVYVSHNVYYGVICLNPEKLHESFEVGFISAYNQRDCLI